MSFRELIWITGFGITLAGIARSEDRHLITVSRETTAILEPLRADGSVDFIADLNRRMSSGVTPENNAAVLLLRAAGSEMLGSHAALYCQMLGIPDVPAEGMISAEFFEVPMKDLKQRVARQDEYDHVIENPWVAEDHPAIARWLEKSAKQFELIEEASRRTHYYTPLIPENIENPSVAAVSLNQAQNLREIARWVSIRCMFRLGQGDAKAAIEDVRLIHRLAVLQSQGLTAIEGLFAFSLEVFARYACLQISASSAITPDLAGELLHEIQSWEPLLHVADKFDMGERYMFIDSFYGLVHDPEVLIFDDKESQAPLRRLALSEGVADEALRLGNQRFNEVIAALRLETPIARRDELAKLESQLDQIREGQNSAWNGFSFFLGTPKVRGKQLGDLMLALRLPSVSSCEAASERSLSNKDLLCVLLAARRFQLEQGRFPESLKLLVPNYLPALPVDRMTGGELRAELRPQRIVVSSSGQNGIFDVDLGQYQGEPAQLRTDDLIMELNLPKSEGMAP